MGFAYSSVHGGVAGRASVAAAAPLRLSPLFVFNFRIVAYCAQISELERGHDGDVVDGRRDAVLAGLPENEW